MPTRADPGPVRVGVISPAAVRIVKVSRPVHPARRRYSTASRAPLPESSASEPSGLKMRSSATWAPGSAGGESSSTPSEWTPKWGLQSAATRSAVSSKGSASCSTTM